MLIKHQLKSSGTIAAPRQRGVVLLIALIMLVAMTLGGIALVRSVNITNSIAGNLAFQQGATNSGDIGIEVALNWLETNNDTSLHGSIAFQGYTAIRQDPPAGQSWDAFWRATLVNQAVTLNPAAPGTFMAYAPSAPNAGGNTVHYAIQRLCLGLGAPGVIGNPCAQPPATASTGGSSKGAGVVALTYGSQVYYRITARIAGPRNTVSYVQAIVAL